MWEEGAERRPTPLIGMIGNDCYGHGLSCVLSVSQPQARRKDRITPGAPLPELGFFYGKSSPERPKPTVASVLSAAKAFI